MRRFKKFEDGHNELAYLDLANNRQDMWQRVCISACLSGTMVARLLLDFNHHNCIFVESTFLLCESIRRSSYCGWRSSRRRLRRTAFLSRRLKWRRRLRGSSPLRAPPGPDLLRLWHWGDS